MLSILLSSSKDAGSPHATTRRHVISARERVARVSSTHPAVHVVCGVDTRVRVWVGLSTASIFGTNRRVCRPVRSEYDILGESQQGGD